MKTKQDFIAEMCLKGMRYLDAEKAFYEYWKKMINEAKRERECSLFC